MTHLVDTSAWIDYLRGNAGPIVDALESLFLSGEAAVCDMVTLELWNGVRGERETRLLTRLLAALPKVPMDDAVWNLAHRTGARCRASGVTVPATDIAIAACATRHGLPVLHRDADFDRILPIASSVTRH